jgi:hypothetical protein
MTYDPFDPFNELVAETDPAVLTAGHEWVKQQFYEDDTMYFDFFLKFADEAEANAALFTEQTNVQDDVVETVLVPKYAAVDVVGQIFKPTGNVLPAEDESGEAVDKMAPLDGWHVNVRHTDEAPELAPYQVFPQTPSRMWA